MGPRRTFKFSRSMKKKVKCTHASASTDGTGTDGSGKKCCGAATPSGTTAMTSAQQTARSLMECTVSASCCPLHCSGCCTSCNIPSRAQRKAAARCAAYSANISGYQQRRKQLAEAAQIKSQNINLRLPGAGNAIKKAASRNNGTPPAPAPVEKSVSRPSSPGSESSFSSLYEPRGYFGLDSPAVRCTDCLELGLEGVDDEYSEEISEVKLSEESSNSALNDFKFLRKKIVLDEKIPYKEVLKLLDEEIAARGDPAFKEGKACGDDDDEAYSIENSDEDYDDNLREAVVSVEELNEVIKGVIQRKRKGSPRRSVVPGRVGRKSNRGCNKRMRKVVGKIKIEMDVFVEPNHVGIVKDGSKAKVCDKKCCTGNLPSFMSTGNPKERAREFKNLSIIEQQQYLSHALCYLANNLEEGTGRPEPSLENCTALQLLSVYFDYEDDHRDQSKYEFISFANEFIRCYLMESMDIGVKTEKGDQYLDTLLGHLNDIIVKVDRTFIKLIEQEDIKIEEEDLLLLRRLFAYAFACGKDLESIKDLVRDNNTAADFYKEICRMLPIDFESFKADVEGRARNPDCPLGSTSHEAGKDGIKADESAIPEDVAHPEV